MKMVRCAAPRTVVFLTVACAVVFLLAASADPPVAIGTMRAAATAANAVQRICSPDTSLKAF